MSMSKPSDDKDLQGLIGEAFPEQMITNWIIIAEVVDNESRDLHMGTSDGMTTWLGTGMLECAKEIMITREMASSESWNDWGEDEGEEE
jgi:hypothetical protein